jgi:hypothetical protein
MVLNLMSHDPTNVVQWQGPLLRVSQRYRGRFSELLRCLPVSNCST